MRIIVDMDEVLADTYHEFGRRYAARFGREVPYDELVGKKYYDLPGAGDLRNDMYQRGFFRHLPVMDNAVPVLEELYREHEVFIVTTATEFKYSMLDKWEWLAEHFPFVHHSRMVFCGSKSVVSGDYMIDDKKRNLATFNGTGLLFDSPHNAYTTGYDRLHNWLEVQAYFGELRQKRQEHG
jgi:5'(3')-deoxyribonucleotidase